MIIDQKMASLLSDFFLDIAKAVFIATFIAPPLQRIGNLLDILLIFTKGLLGVIAFLYLSRVLLQIKLNE